MNSVAQLWAYSLQITSTITRWVEVHDKKHTILTYSKIDQLKLMTLRTWELRYRLPVYEILDLVVPVLRVVVKGHLRRKKPLAGLRVPVSTLTGVAAERILLDQIAKKFPDAQHIGIWRAEERERQLRRERLVESEGITIRQLGTVTLLSSQSVGGYIDAYKKQVHAKRVEEATELANKDRKRKSYRFNPWR